MADDCRHGREHEHHHHMHPGLAEGMTPSYVRKLQLVLALAVLYLLVQVLGSYFSGSLALLADAGHKLADVGAIVLALVASWFSALPHSPRRTFGFYRLEILAALINGMGLLVVALLILWEAYERFVTHAPVSVEGGVMLVVALIGLVINLVSAWLLFPVHGQNLNVKGALFHILADIVNSLGTMVTAGLILWLGATWLDTLISVLIAVLVLFNAARIFGEAFNILMETAPVHLDVDFVRHYLMQQPGVRDVHDLHLWTITTGKDALLAHVQVAEGDFNHETVCRLENLLRERFGLCHITIQLEPVGFQEPAIQF